MGNNGRPSLRPLKIHEKQDHPQYRGCRPGHRVHSDEQRGRILTSLPLVTLPPASSRRRSRWDARIRAAYTPRRWGPTAPCAQSTDIIARAPAAPQTPPPHAVRSGERSRARAQTASAASAIPLLGRSTRMSVRCASPTCMSTRASGWNPAVARTGRLDRRQYLASMTVSLRVSGGLAR